MAQPAKLYEAIGGAAGCRALATAFYAHVERDPLLRPLFPSTFTCAIEEFSAFLVQFLGGESSATQRRWWLSLAESHRRFAIGPRERDAWLKAMTATLGDPAVIADTSARGELLEFFRHSSAHVVPGQEPGPPPKGELAALWKEQLALNHAVAALRAAESGEALRSPALLARFARCPAVHASFLALAARSQAAWLREYASDQVRAHPTLIEERYNGWRTLLHDAAAGGNLSLVEQLIDMGGGKTAEDDRAPSPLYCVANECSAPEAGDIVRMLLRRSSAQVNAVYGVKRCTALHMAARRGNVDVIAALLDGGADLEARDSAGETPLRRAVNCNQIDAAELFLARGADPHSQGSRGLTPALAARSRSMRQVFGLR